MSQNKTERSHSVRFNHWFWNSQFMNWIAARAVRFSGWCWRKQYARD